MAPSRALLSFIERGENGRSLVACFNDLALPEIFLRAVERIQDHALDLFVGKAVAGLNLNFRFLAAPLLARRNVQNAVSVDEKFDLDARHSRSHRRNTLQVKTRERAAILGKFALALQHVNGDVGLPIDLRGIERG